MTQPESAEAPDICTLCNGEFSLEDEGGISGTLGMLPCCFCPTCHAGLFDLYDQMYGKEYYDCLEEDDDGPKAA
jgi:hypothetical protein